MRPKKTLNKRIFEALVETQCTLEEISAYFRCDLKIVQRYCHETYGMGFREVQRSIAPAGLLSLRKKQFQKAIKGAGDTAMLKHLGVQYLNQRDRVESHSKTVNLHYNVPNEMKDARKVQERIDQLKKKLLVQNTMDTTAESMDAKTQENKEAIADASASSEDS